MTIKFLTKHRATLNCTHDAHMRIEIAGMSRDVCETCGRVSVEYLGDHLSAESAQAIADALDESGDSYDSDAA
jgi:hypothetical protein